MLDGIQLTLLIGPGAPLPAPKEVIDALQSIQVTSSSTGSGFQLTFAVSKQSLLQNILLPAGYFDPMITRVIIMVTLKGFPNVIMDGIVTRQEVSPSNEAAHSTLTITGEDLSVLMDVVELKVPYPSMTEVAMVRFALLPYLALGVIPIVIPPIIPVTPIFLDFWITQTGTHLQFIQGLAREMGYVFFVNPGPMLGQSIAYFGPDISDPLPQPALNVNMDAHTNVETLSFSLDGLAKKIRLYTIMDPITHKIPFPIPVPNVNIFKPPLGARPTPPAKLEFARDGANLRPDEAAQRILGDLMNNSAAVTGNGTLDVLRYGNILRPRRVVGVRGAGLTYDGFYYVEGVTHSLKRGEYKQNFSLSRDGLISNTPRVLP